MNAKNLILLFFCLTAYLGNSFIFPLLGENKRISSSGQVEDNRVSELKRIIDALADLPAAEVALLPKNIAAPLTVGRWINSSSVDGVRIASVSGADKSGGAGPRPLGELFAPDQITGRDKTSLLLNGTYGSIIGLQDYIEKNFTVEKGVFVESLKVQGYQFEMIASIFVREE